MQTGWRQLNRKRAAAQTNKNTRGGWVAKRVGDRINKNYDKRNKCQVGQQHEVEGRSIYFLLILSALAETEKTGFETKYQHYAKETRISIKLGYHAVLVRRKGIRIYRHQQVVQEPAQYAANAVNSSLRC